MMLKLTYKYADPGNCRVYYHANQRLYCWQMDDYRAKRFALYLCSSDGEPDTPVRPDVFLTVEMPLGEEQIGRELLAFLREQKVPLTLSASPALFRACGEALYGKRWKSPLADALGVSARSVNRWAAGEWPVPEGVANDLAALLAERGKTITSLQHEISKYASDT